ncbi:hypothetical protein TIFTF001_019395 [Ficus carica]|uniref:Enoyl reductase (ER) domain-containing protein n=1 Tax=Ficus carica TaxID=3494 RepID=A0AA88AEA4_FICCA|nr:hypothetical protein TIFTF001_019395 [Ficus carica]
MAEKLMHAVQYSGYGGGASGLNHVEVPIPNPNKDEILVKVEAASINPFDWKVQEGMMRPILPPKFPYIPSLDRVMTYNSPQAKISLGSDVAGEVIKVGSSVKNLKAGDKVVGYVDPRGGGLAQFAACKESWTTKRPLEVSASSAASLPVAGLTALQALTKYAGMRLDGNGHPKNILVTAASGGVGHFAVQLAKLGNAHVTATCGARNLEFVKSLGADEVIDYRTPEGAALKSPSGRKFDAVIHCTTGIPWSTFEPNLSSHGKVVDITPSFSGMITFALQKLTFSKKQLVPLLLMPNRENLEFLVNLVKEGKLKTVIDSKHPLSNAEDAWAQSIDGHATGKIIVEN